MTGKNATDPPLIAGLGVGGYRSLRELQYLGPLRRVTLLAGQNDAGKSNILRFAATMLRARPAAFEWHDAPQPAGPRLLLATAQSGAAFTHPRLEQCQQRDLAAFRSFLEGDAFRPVGGDTVWLTYSAGNDQPQQGARAWSLDDQLLDTALREAQPQQVLSNLSSALTSTSGGARLDDLRRVLEALFPLRMPPVATIGAFRRISVVADQGEPDGRGQLDLPDEHSGANLIGRLAALESPPAQSFAEHRAKFDAISEFARTVLDDPDVAIRIPVDQTAINIQQGGRTLPLTSHGTGIHQVIILAAAATLLEGHLVCVEEPEVHLHPLLQRKLIRYLSEATSNQYLIATHSAHMLDYERATVLHCKNDTDRGTVVSVASSLQSIADVCSDLGYRPSDLIQANAVIWVEGPSDRIYLRRWLNLTAPGEFVEGIHYSVMFYGGALLRHLSAEDPAVDEFISLRRLNRHSAILIDSDRDSPRARINATKRRVDHEFAQEGMPGFSWITAGRTIENYIPHQLLAKAVEEVHSSAVLESPDDRWAAPLTLGRAASVRRGRGATGQADARQIRPDKVKIARWVCEHLTDGDLQTLDLRTRVNDVVSFIRRANGSTPPPRVRVAG